MHFAVDDVHQLRFMGVLIDRGDAYSLLQPDRHCSRSFVRYIHLPFTFILFSHSLLFDVSEGRTKSKKLGSNLRVCCQQHLRRCYPVAQYFDPEKTSYRSRRVQKVFLYFNFNLSVPNGETQKIILHWSTTEVSWFIRLARSGESSLNRFKSCSS